MKNAYRWALIVTCVWSLFLTTFLVDRGTANAAPLRGDFNTDLTVNLVDFNLLLPALHTTNAKFALTGSDNNYIDLFDYNEFLKTLGTSAPISKSTQLACHLEQRQPNPAKMLNVGTWNIGDGTDAQDEAKTYVVAQKFIEFNLDILLVQEINRLREMPYTDVMQTNFVRNMQSKVPYTLYFYPEFQSKVSHSVAIVSRFPIVETGFVDIAGGRKIQYALIDSPAGKLKVFNVHLQRKEDNMCPGMEDSVEFIKSKIVAGDTYIVGGDFNAEFDPKRGFFENVNGGQHYCPYEQSFAKLFYVGCSTADCRNRGIDYLIGGNGNNPAVYQYCQKEGYGFVDAHELYVGTIEM